MREFILFTVLTTVFITNLMAQCQESRDLTIKEFDSFVKVWKDLKEVEKPTDEKLFALAKKYNVKQGSLKEENQERFVKEYPDFVREIKKLQKDYETRKIKQQSQSCKLYGIKETKYSRLVSEYSTCPIFKKKVAKRLNIMRR